MNRIFGEQLKKQSYIFLVIALFVNYDTEILQLIFPNEISS